MFDPASVPPAFTAADDLLAARVEEAGLNAAQPPEQLLKDGWLLRYSPGKARRSRSVNAIAAGRQPLAEKLAYCRAFYASVGLPCLYRITPFSRPDGLDAALAAGGLRAEDETRVMVQAAAPSAMPLRHDASDLSTAEFARCAGELRGSTPEQMTAHAARLAASPLLRSAHRLALLDGGRVVAVGQSVIEDDLVGLYDIVTAEDARGRGLATALTRELLRRAFAAGARIAYLQVSADNVAARRVYGRLGFVDRYAYWYRAYPPPVRKGGNEGEAPR